MPFLFIAVPLSAMVVLNILFSWIDHRSTLWAAFGVALFQMAFSIADFVRVLQSGEAVQSTFFGFFTVDLFGAVVLLIIGLVACITIVLAGETVHKTRFTFGSAVLLLMIGMNGVVMVRDVFSLYVFIEVTAAASFLLIALNKKRDELEGAFKYYLMSAIATTMMLFAIILLFALTGETSYSALSQYIAQQNGQYPLALQAAFILFSAALLMKSGTVPFHTWVPDAHSSAPSPVSVMLAGVVIKVSGVYGLMRIYGDVFLYDRSIGLVLAVLGFASIVIGALGAIGQSDIKRMLAFSSVSQIGYIVLAVSTGSPLGFLGALMHFFNHATFKSLLFVDAAAVAEQTGTRNMNEMGGLAARMPVTGATSVIGLLSMAGIPPLSGFWSKLIIIMALWQRMPGLAIAALCASVLTLTYFLLLQKKVFFGKTAPAMEAVTECGPRLQFAQIALSCVNVLSGLLFPLLLVLLQNAGFFG